MDQYRTTQARIRGLSEVEQLEQLIEDYGLAILLEHNDLEEIDVLEILVNKGLIDLEDYFYTDMENLDDQS
jgi:hypothetical protein